MDPAAPQTQTYDLRDASDRGLRRMVTVQGDSRTFFHHPGANDRFGASSINIDQLSDAGIKLLYLGYLTLLDELDRLLPEGRTLAAKVLSEARAEGMRTCVDLASFKSGTYRDVVEATLREIDFLFANELEAEQATGVRLTVEADSDDMMRAARILKSGGVNDAVIIHSPGQVVWCGNGVEHTVTPDPIPPERLSVRLARAMLSPRA